MCLLPFADSSKYTPREGISSADLLTDLLVEIGDTPHLHRLGKDIEGCEGQSQQD